MSLKGQGKGLQYSRNKAAFLKEAANSNQRKSIQRTTPTNSSWTPLGTNQELNEQLFDERKDLVMSWFDKWSDRQRKIFFDVMLSKCRQSQIKYLYDELEPAIPKQNLDFSKLFPRFLTLHIFSFLDPRTLCLCARVCWHWKYLSEHDNIWMPKCLQFGWFLNFPVSPLVVGVWKKLYGDCVTDLKRGITPSFIQQAKADDVDVVEDINGSSSDVEYSPDSVSTDGQGFVSPPLPASKVKTLMKPTIASLLKSKVNEGAHLKNSPSALRTKSGSLQSLASIKCKDHSKTTKRLDLQAKRERKEAVTTTALPPQNYTEIQSSLPQRPKLAKIWNPGYEPDKQSHKRIDYVDSLCPVWRVKDASFDSD